MYQRDITPILSRLFKEYPVITLTGPRQAGKTTLCRNTFAQHDYVNLEDIELRAFANQDPKGFLNQYQKGLIIDEIQHAPDLPSYIQVRVDESQKNGQYILTGSQQFEVTNSINQSLAGRTALLRLLPLSYEEVYYNDKKTSLQEILYKGFYPRILANDLNPTEASSFYLNTYVERDLRQLAQLKNLQQFELFLKLCATQVGQLVNYSRLANDCGVDQKTVKHWLSLLNASYIIYLVPPHFQNFRKRLTKLSKLYFFDVGLASYLLGIHQPELIDRHPLRGALFENFIITEILKGRYNQGKVSNIYFFRDHVGNEVDIVLDYGDKVTSIEIKSAQTVNSSFYKGLNY